MNAVCPRCGGYVLPEHIQTASGFAKCPHCEVIFDARAQLPSDACAFHQALPKPHTCHWHLRGGHEQLTIHPHAFVLKHTLAASACLAAGAAIAGVLVFHTMHPAIFAAYAILASTLLLAIWFHGWVQESERTVLTFLPHHLRIQQAELRPTETRELPYAILVNAYCHERHEHFPGEGPQRYYEAKARLDDGREIDLLPEQLTPEPVLYTVQEVNRRLAREHAHQAMSA